MCVLWGIIYRARSCWKIISLGVVAVIHHIEPHWTPLIVFLQLCTFLCFIFYIDFYYQADTVHFTEEFINSEIGFFLEHFSWRDTYIKLFFYISLRQLRRSETCNDFVLSTQHRNAELKCSALVNLVHFKPATCRHAKTYSMKVILRLYPQRAIFRCKFTRGYCSRQNSSGLELK